MSGAGAGDRAEVEAVVSIPEQAPDLAGFRRLVVRTMPLLAWHHGAMTVLALGEGNDFDAPWTLLVSHEWEVVPAVVEGEVRFVVFRDVDEPGEPKRREIGWVTRLADVPALIVRHGVESYLAAMAADVKGSGVYDVTFA